MEVSRSVSLKASAKPAIVSWQAAPFVAPFDFAVGEVNAIQWPPPATLPKPTGDLCFELAAGDVLFGSLVSIDDKEVELDIPRLGRIHVQRSNLHRIYRWRDGADLIYLGPNGLHRLARADRTEELARRIGPTRDRP